MSSEMPTIVLPIIVVADAEVDWEWTRMEDLLIHIFPNTHIAIGIVATSVTGLATGVGGSGCC